MSYSTSRDTSSALSDTIEIKAGEGFLLEPLPDTCIMLMKKIHGIISGLSLRG